MVSIFVLLDIHDHYKKNLNIFYQQCWKGFFIRGNIHICWSGWFSWIRIRILEKKKMDPVISEGSKADPILIFRLNHGSILYGCSFHIAHVWCKQLFFRKKNQIWRLFRCNQMSSTERNAWFTSCVGINEQSSIIKPWFKAILWSNDENYFSTPFLVL